jgi:hypothetical protein
MKDKKRMSQYRCFFPIIVFLFIAALGDDALCGPATVQGTEYNPVINPNDFVPEVTNKYFALKPGMKFTYESKTSEGTDRIEIVVANETRKVMGVTTTVVSEWVWSNGVLTEDTRNSYAQHKDGTVWYFGEAVDNYKNGKVKDHQGSWEGGAKGAKPGIMMLKDPKLNDTYRHEYSKGKIEDVATVAGIGKKVTVPYGTFDGCLQIRVSSRIDKTDEFRYHCPSIGFLVLKESVPAGKEKTELISVAE